MADSLNPFSGFKGGGTLEQKPVKAAKKSSSKKTTNYGSLPANPTGDRAYDAAATAQVVQNKKAAQQSNLPPDFLSFYNQYAPGVQQSNAAQIAASLNAINRAYGNYENNLTNQYGQNAAKAQALYNALGKSILGDQGTLDAAYKNAQTQAGNHATAATSAINQAANAAFNDQLSALKALGIDDALANQLANNNGSISADQAADVSRANTAAQQVEDYLTKNQSSADRYNTQVGQAQRVAGVQAANSIQQALQSALAQVQLQQMQAQLSAQSSAESPQDVFNQVLDAYNAEYGSKSDQLSAQELAAQLGLKQQQYNYQKQQDQVKNQAALVNQALAWLKLNPGNDFNTAMQAVASGYGS